MGLPTFAYISMSCDALVSVDVTQSGKKEMRPCGAEIESDILVHYPDKGYADGVLDLADLAKSAMDAGWVLYLDEWVCPNCREEIHKSSPCIRES